MIDGANDQFYNLREQLRSLSEEDAITLASGYIEANAGELDAAYLKLMLTAEGAQLQAHTQDHAFLGSPAAQTVLGTNKLFGTHTEQSTSEGLFWLRRAHNSGNGKASIVLGGAYLDGKHLKRDATKALEYIAVAAEAGEPAAQYIYAIQLIDGDGVAEDQEEGVLWLRRAAAKGYQRAIDVLNENDIPLADT